MSGIRHRRCFTYLELIAAIVILAITLVPASRFLTDSMTARRHLERDRILVILATQVIEEQMAAINDTFTTTDEEGTFVAQGLPEIAYRKRRRDASDQGGIPGLLMVIEVEVWEDKNGDLRRNNGETRVRLFTKMARSIES